MAEQPLNAAILGAAALTLVYATAVVCRPTISPEIAQAFITFESTGSLRQALRHFVVFNEVWYRPLSFYLTNHLLFQLIDFHNVYAIKAAGMCLIVLNGFVVAKLSRVLFGSSVTEQLCVFGLVITHPAYLGIAIDGSGIVDPVFNIFLNLFAINFLKLLWAPDGAGVLPKDAQQRRPWQLVVFCCVCIVGAITSQERGLAVFAIAGSLLLHRYCWHGRFKQLPSIPAFVVMAFALVTFALYIVFVYAAKQSWSGPVYRTAFEPAYVLENLAKAVEFPFRFYLLKTGKSYDVHLEWWFNCFAAPLAAALCAYVLRVCRMHYRPERARFLILGLLFACALPIPIWCGGSYWHFYTAAMYASIGTGRAVCFWINTGGQRFRASLVFAFFLWLGLSTVRGINQELAPGSDLLAYMLLVPEALHDSVLFADAGSSPQVVYYDTGSYETDTWGFGGQGNLFKYLYRDPAIVEIALVHGKVLPRDKPLCNTVEGKRAAFFGFDREQFHWYAIEKKDYCAALR